MPDPKSRAKKIKLLLFDVDGVLTDGKLFFFPAPAGVELTTRNHAAQHEGRRSREEPDHDEDAAEELERTRHPDDERRHTGRHRHGKTEELPHAVPEEEEPRHDA